MTNKRTGNGQNGERIESSSILAPLLRDRMTIYGAVDKRCLVEGTPRLRRGRVVWRWRGFFRRWQLGDDVVVVHLHAEAASALGHGGEGGVVGEHFGHGDFGADDGSCAAAVHALDAAATAAEVADEGSGEFVGGFDFYAHDGFEEGGFRLLHAFAEGEARGHLEGHFAGVYVVVAAVEDGDLDVDYGIAGEEAAGGGFADAFFYGGNVLAGDGSAEDLVFEDDAAAAGEGFDAEFAVAELAVASGLFFVAALGFGACRERFRGRELWGL